MNPLITKLKALVAERDAILSKGDEITAEDITKAKDLNAQAKAVQTQLEDLKSLHGEQIDIKQYLSEGVNRLPNGADVLGVQKSGHVTTENGVVTEGLGLTDRQKKAIGTNEYRDAFRAYAMKGEARLSTAEVKTLTEGIDDAGGYLVPAQTLAKLIEKAIAPTRVNGLVTRIPTSKDALTMPRVVYTTDDIYSTGIRATLTGESPSSGSAHRVTDPVFGNHRIEIGTWMLSMPVSNDLIEDADFPLLAWIGQKFAETRDLLYDNQILNGSGVGANPQGALLSPGSTGYVPYSLSGVANALGADAIRGLPFEVPEQYADQAKWIMNRASAGKAIAQLKDSENRYLFSKGGMYPGIAERTPDSLNGDPIAWSAFMPNVGDGAYPVLYGDLRGFLLAERISLSVQFLRERYAEENQTLALGRLRFGGKVVEPWRLRLLKSDDA